MLTNEISWVRILGVCTAIALVASASQPTISSASAAPPFFPTSADQKAVALRVALAEATKTLPGGGSATNSTAITTSGKWPSNITRVSYVGSYRQSAASLTGLEEAPNDVAVVVVQMTGSFRVEVPAPPRRAGLCDGTPDDDRRGRHHKADARLLS
jgi:hypothetical protein